MSFLIYGASGYTGKIIVESAIRQGLKPTLAGRTEGKIKPLAAQYQLEYMVFSLEDVNAVAKQLSAFDLVLNCAGPFSRTAKAMIEACLLSNTHYLDITGEIEVFELAKSYNKAAKENNIIVMSGVGFDVVPTDCMAKHLHDKMPDATHLELAWAGLGGNISHGTMSTMVENLGKSGAIRKDGKITPSPIGKIGREIDFGTKKLFCMSIPWGDVSTAYFTTKIPNIMVLSAVPKSAYYTMKLQALFNPIVGINAVKNVIQNYVDKNIEGPNETIRDKGISLIYGKVSNAAGKTVEARLQTAEGYKLTAEMALIITNKILQNKNLPAGYHTPAELFGANLILEMPNSKYF